MTVARTILLSLILTVTGHASAETYTCTAATNLAKVGAPKTSEVGVTSDTGKKECRFSINGAAVGSPPRAAVLEGLNAVITGKAVLMLDSGDVRAIANLLLSSSDQRSPDAALISVLRENSKDLARCLASFKGRVKGAVISKADIFCGGVTKGAIPIGGGSTVILGESQGMHVLAVSPSKGVVHYVFFPPDYRQGKPIP